MRAIWNPVMRERLGDCCGRGRVCRCKCRIGHHQASRHWEIETYHNAKLVAPGGPCHQAIAFRKDRRVAKPVGSVYEAFTEILMDRHMKIIGALPEDGKALTAPTLASLGINELPLYGHYVQERVDTNSFARSGIAAIGRKQQGMHAGARAGSPRQFASISSTSALGGSGLGAIEPPAPCPCIAATVLCHASGGRATGSCLERGLHPVKETSPCTIQEMTVERPVTSSVHRSGCARCVDGGVDVLNSGCTPSRKHASPHGSVCGSSLKPAHEVGQACTVMSPHAFSGVRRNQRPRRGGAQAVIPPTMRFHARTGERSRSP